MATTSVGRDEIGASALRRRFNARMDSSNVSISASMACCWYSREFAWHGYIVKPNSTAVCVLLLFREVLASWLHVLMSADLQDSRGS